MQETDLSLIIFGPVTLGLGLFFARQDDRLSLMDWALVSCGVPLMYALSLLWTYDPSGADFQFLTQQSHRSWISIAGHLNIQFLMGIDGISLMLVLLTTLVTPVVILSTRRAAVRHYREFLLVLLALETGILGCLLSLDLILFMFFWMATLFLVFLLIAVWGSGSDNRGAIKFLVMAMLGSALMLIGILSLHSLSEHPTFSILRLYSDSYIKELPLSTQSWLFWAFFIAFAVLIPVFPLHTWMPDADSDAPFAGSAMILAALTKLGAYGVLRICIPLFPDATEHFSMLISILAVIGIIYAGWIAIAQRDLRRLVAYLAISQMGLVLLGIFTLGANGIIGAIIFMFGQGLAIAGLVVMFGMLHERCNTTRIMDFGGLLKYMPILGAFMIAIIVAAIALPPMSTFNGLFLIMLGVFETGLDQGVAWYILGVLAMSGFIWWAVSLTLTHYRVMLGKSTRQENGKVGDLGIREITLLIPLVIVLLWMGFSSSGITRRVEPSVLNTVGFITAPVREVENYPGPTTSDFSGEAVEFIESAEGDDD
jgi:NADH-quinone oxidoreductase subunit M